MTNNDRIESLETENHNLRNQLAALAARVSALEPKPARAPEPARPVVQGVFTPRVPIEAMPDETQFAKLQEIVLQRYPILVPRGPQALPMDQFHEHFRYGFSWLLLAQRRAEPNKQYDVAYFCKQAAAFHRADVGLKPFLCATVGIGDVAYSSLDDFPYGLSIGLVADCFRDLDRVDLTAGWRRVLQGQVLTPFGSSGQTSTMPMRRMVGPNG